MKLFQSSSKFQVGCSNPEKCEEICAVESGCSNKAYILLVLKVLPHGKGFKRLSFYKHERVRGNVSIDNFIKVVIKL